MEELLETWRINNRINLYLLEALEEDSLTVPLTKGKTVGGQLAHVHNVRLMWLKAAAPDLNEPMVKLEPTATKAELAAGLESSSKAIEELLRRAGSPGGKVKGFKPHAAGFLGYMIAHEGFHRGHLELALRQAGKPLPDKIAYGSWEWGSR
ncbi:MAG: DinB family protein [Fimbriimonas sp.]